MNPAKCGTCVKITSSSEENFSFGVITSLKQNPEDYNNWNYSCTGHPFSIAISALLHHDTCANTKRYIMFGFATNTSMSMA